MYRCLDSQSERCHQQIVHSLEERSPGPEVSSSLGVSRSPVSIAVARRKRHSRLANRSTFALNGSLGVKTCSDGRFEGFVIFSVLKLSDHCLGCKPASDSVAARALLALFRNWTGALASIATVGFDLPERRH
jgi:hypothetical protein